MTCFGLQVYGRRGCSKFRVRKSLVQGLGLFELECRAVSMILKTSSRFQGHEAQRMRRATALGPLMSKSMLNALNCMLKPIRIGFLGLSYTIIIMGNPQTSIGTSTITPGSFFCTLKLGRCAE